MADGYAIFLAIDFNLGLIVFREKSWLMECLSRSIAALSILSVSFYAAVTSELFAASNYHLPHPPSPRNPDAIFTSHVHT
jgi:hypothetical protein